MFFAVILAAALTHIPYLRAAAVPAAEALTAAERVAQIRDIGKLLLSAGLLLGIALFFAIFFIYPMIRGRRRKRASCAP